MGYVLKIHVHVAIIVLIRALLKAQSIGIMVAWVTRNRKANKKPNRIQEETSETQFSFFLIINNLLN